MINWVDWTAQPNGTTALGTITTAPGPIGVTFSGQIQFSQTAGGTYYYTVGGSGPNPYSGVANAPSTPDIVAMATASTRTITFSQAVLNPVMAIVSLNGNSYDFDSPFDVLSYGWGYWGNGTMTEAAGDVLNVTGEGHGIIQFQGSFTSISWTSSNYENWHGMTVGTPVPAPGSVALLGLGLLALVRLRRR